MTKLKSIAAIYVGLYLLLPNCLCQVLSVFGIEGHAHFSSLVIEQDSEVSGNNLVATPICHCDDDCSKVAELAPLGSENFDLEWEKSDVQLVDSDSPEVDDFSLINSRGPPDGTTRWTLAPFSGVFLL